MLTSAEITALVNTGGVKRTRPTRTTHNKWYDGEQWHAGKPPLDSNVHFEGNVGTLRRSRKGATRRNANGRRYIVGQYEAPQVVAYKVTP